jgi:hypothetical protein
MFVPTAHLHGLLPLGLLEEYQFWQNKVPYGPFGLGNCCFEHLKQKWGDS